MVGFNRRFAPQVAKIHELLAGVTGPKAMIVTVNAGTIPAKHWTQDPEVGGGRIIGEACHFIDLLRFLAGNEVKKVHVVPLGGSENGQSDNVTFTLGFGDGSTGTVHYLANGNRAFPKERLEIFAGGRILQLDNFRRLTGYGWPKFKSLNLWRQDKGHRAMMKLTTSALRAGESAPIPFGQIVEVTRLSFEVAAKIACGSGDAVSLQDSATECVLNS